MAAYRSRVNAGHGAGGFRGTGLVSVKIGVCHHMDGPRFSNDAYMPLHVGRAGAPRPIPGMAGDDQGRNISMRNGSWAELTGLYWLRHNVEADFLGLMHYRRFLDFRFRHRGGTIGDVSEATILRFRLTPRRVASLCLRYDLLVPAPMQFGAAGRRRSVLDQYARKHHREHYMLALETVRKRTPDLYDFALATANGNSLRCCNISVMRREFFAMYVDWLVGILEAVESQIDLARLAPDQRRVIGFLGERLTSSYVDYLVAHHGAICREFGIVLAEFPQLSAAPA